MSRILIAEDDELISRFIQKGLRAAGYTAHVVSDGEQARASLLADEFDLLILDMALPERDGFQVLQGIRARGDATPVLVLTGRPELRDVVACLSVGADDYMTKPFRFEELLARVRTRLRARGTEDPITLSSGGVELDLRSRRVTLDGREVDLTGREFSLLEMFMRHPDQVLTRSQLVSNVWGYYFDPGSNVVNVYVGALRKKLGEESIETLRGIGYRFPSRRASSTSHAPPSEGIA